MNIFISAGEASGDALGAALLQALKERVPTIKATGMGGPRMVSEGFEAIRDANELGVLGLFEVLRHLPRLFRLRDDLANYVAAQPPDVAILIDAPDFNIRLAKKLHAQGIPVIFYVGPSVWAWRPGRAARYGKYIDKLLVLFPFEVSVWQKHQVDVTCVGHPLIDEIPEPRPQTTNLKKTIAILPGSRLSEIERHFQILLDAAARLKSEGLVDDFVVPVASTVDSDRLRTAIRCSGLESVVNLVVCKPDDSRSKHNALAKSILALVASGTATLEAALLGLPQIVVYRVNLWTWLLMKPFVKLKHLGLVNLIAGREVAPELLQGQFNVNQVYTTAKLLLVDEQARRAVIEGSQEVRDRLGERGAAKRAAEAVLDFVSCTSATGE